MLTYEESSFSSIVPDSVEWSASTTAFIDLESIPFNPENFLYVNPGLVSFIRKKLREFDYRKNFTDHYLYFCSTINYLHHVDKRYKGKEYVPINYKIMVSVISKYKYPEIVSNLETWKVVESNESYRQNTYSKGYKLLSPYDSGIKRIPVKDVMINNKINRFKLSSFKELKKLPYPYQYLSMTNTWIEIDRRRASYYNTSTYQFADENTYNSNYYSISAYADGDYRFSVDTTGFRAHTNLTNLKKDFRKFLSVWNEPLGQIDIKNSQPLFLYFLIQDEPTIPDEEKDRFKELVESGRFYEYFMTKLGLPEDQRDSVKQKVLTALYDHCREKDGRYIVTLTKEFPGIVNFIKEVKKEDYRSLAYMLQKAESKFVIEDVVSEFINLYGHRYEFISTIHDSIVIRASMMEEAETIMRGCFMDMGINPILSKEFF